MRDLAVCDWTDFVGLERRYGDGFAIERHELNFVAAPLVDQHYGPDVTGLQTILRQIDCEYDSFSFAKH